MMEVEGYVDDRGGDGGGIGVLGGGTEVSSD